MNKRSLLIVLTVMAAALAASADPLAKGSNERGAAESPRDQTQPGAPVPIWPEGVPGAIKEGGPETLAEGLVRNVHEPSLTPYPAAPGRANRTAVVVCPGGGYTVLAIDKEGRAVAEWLNSLGVSAFVLKYRLKEYGNPVPLEDWMIE